MQTAEIIARPHSLPIHPTPLLRERAFGIVQGMTRQEIEERFPNDQHAWRRTPSGAAPPDAETHQQVIERCARFISEVIGEQPDGSQVLVICHGGSLSGLVLSALDFPISAYRKLHFSNASLSILEVSENPTLRLMNDTCHLANVEVTDVDADNAE
jgi:broad specificity phosphatase PhoE